MLKFEVYTVEQDSDRKYGPKKGDIRVRFPEYNEDYCVDKDENGELYFAVPNILNHPENEVNRLFKGRIKDAYDTIVNGDGDIIQSSYLFGFKMINVIKFVNYDYGREMRKKFLEGWKNSEFGWGIEAGNINSFNELSSVCEDMRVYNPFITLEDNGTIFFFETEEEAHSKMIEILGICKDYAERYKSAKNREEKEIVFQDIEKEYGLFSVVMNYLISKNIECTSDKEYQFRVVQMVR